MSSLRHDSQWVIRCWTADHEELVQVQAWAIEYTVSQKFTRIYSGYKRLSILQAPALTGGGGGGKFLYVVAGIVDS